MMLGQAIQICRMKKVSLYRVIETWSFYNAIALIIAFGFTVFRADLNALLFVFSISMISLIYLNRKNLFITRPFFGIANTLTLIRLLIIILCFCYIDLTDTEVLFYGLLFAVILDFFDGLAARYFNESSFFGQYFDMEVDAFYVLLMCSFYFIYLDVPVWIIIPGLLRYLFRVYTFCFPKPQYREEKKTYATVIAASYFIILLLGLITEGFLQNSILLLGSMAIVISFLIGFNQYVRQ